MSGYHEEDALGKAYDARLARRLLHYLRPYKWQVICALALTRAVSPLEAVGPYLFHVAVDWYIVPVTRNLLPLAAGIHGLLWVAAAFLGALVLSFLVLYIQVRVMQGVVQETMYDLRK